MQFKCFYIILFFLIAQSSWGYSKTECTDAKDCVVKGNKLWQSSKSKKTRLRAKQYFIKACKMGDGMACDLKSMSLDADMRVEYVDKKDHKKNKASTSSSFVPLPVNKKYSFKRSYIDTRLKSFTKVLQEAKARPFIGTKTGKILGFKFLEFMPGSIHEELGLKVGDIILEVNGKPVDTPQKAMEVYQSHKNLDHIQFKVLRSGSTIVLDYTIN